MELVITNLQQNFLPPTVPFAQSVHVLIAGMPIHLLGLAPLDKVLGDVLVDVTEATWVTY